MKNIVNAITKPELTEIMLRWAKKLGWNYSKDDVDAYFKINGPDIYSLKLFNNVTNEYELIGCVSISRYHKRIKPNSSSFVSSIGLFIIKEEYRGKSHGQQLLDYAIKQLTGSKITSLNSVPKVASYYIRNGFFRSGVTNSHFSLNSKNMKKSSGKKISDELVTIDSTPIEKIHAYEAGLFIDSLERKNFLSVWLTRPDAVVVTYSSGSNIEGYGVLTVCNNLEDIKCYRISPLIADTIDIAARLFNQLFSFIGNSNFDIIEMNAISNINIYLLDLFKNLGFSKIEDGDTELMVTNPSKTIKTNASLFKVIALSPLEFPHEELQISKNIFSL